MTFIKSSVIALVFEYRERFVFLTNIFFVLGYRTLLALHSAGHAQRVNFYSNPNVIFPGTNTPTGTVNANNAKVINDQRVAQANVGDESETCGKFKKNNLT